MEDKIQDKLKQQAVALRYDLETDVAPVVVAKGQGYIADSIVKLAEASGIPVKEDAKLMEYLMSLDLYEEIPPELYPIIAEILAFIYRMDQEF